MIDEIELHREEFRALCRRFHVRRLDLFGSAARGDFDPSTATSILSSNSTGAHLSILSTPTSDKGRVGGAARPEGRFGGAERSAQSVSKGEHRAKPRERLCSVTPGAICGMR